MYNTKEIVNFIKNVPLFQGLKNRQLELMAKRFVERKYKTGDAIVVQGHGGEGFFVVVTGKAEAIRTRSDGENVVVNNFGPGDFFGEMALLDDGLRTASVVAQEATECLVLTRWDFIGTLREDADMAVSILQEMARRFRIALDTL